MQSHLLKNFNGVGTKKARATVGCQHSGQTGDVKDGRIDFTQCKTSERYFEVVSHNIPIAELYKLIDTCSNSEENEFCAVLIAIESLELQKKYEGRFLL